MEGSNSFSDHEMQNCNNNIPITKITYSSSPRKLEMWRQTPRNISTHVSSLVYYKSTGSAMKLLMIMVGSYMADLLLISICRLVLETLGPLPQERKCFRMINGVLVERTVKDIAPALETNSKGLKKVLDELVKQYKRQQEEMEKWKVGAAFPFSNLDAPNFGCASHMLELNETIPSGHR